jgi:4-amino-4-deoxy-L-arabinose transferase-like glycosyltransferase
MNSSAPSPGFKSGANEKRWWIALLAATVVQVAFQIAWFWRFHAHNINLDGIEYVGLARHLVDGDWKASLHAYWSPLISWIIAAASFLAGDFTRTAKLVTIAGFLLCLPLSYVLALRLWRSRTAAALAMFCFSAARGIVEMTVGSILADFLLTASVLLYFILLLNALRTNSRSSWIALSAAHTLAFLAKAIAMPWLAISTALAVLLRNWRLPRHFVVSLLLAFLFPALVWASWGMVLRAKYGVFTTGNQLRANLMINWHRAQTHHPRGDALEFVEEPSRYDQYMVWASPFSQIQSFNLRNAGLLPMIAAAEVENLPRAVKEIVILLTPVGVVALVLMVGLLIQNRSRYENEIYFAAIALVSTLSLIVAYCMLVFDTRYVIPITPILISLACPLLLPHDMAPEAPHVSRWLQRSGLVLLAACFVFFAVYWASPFRTADRDFESSCYNAAAILRNTKPAGTLVSIGNGPYPEHGVGFEAGAYVAYFAGWRVVGENSELPHGLEIDALANKALAAKADAIAAWGSPANPSYLQIVDRIRRAPELVSASTVSDPQKGEVGTVFVFHRQD